MRLPKEKYLTKDSELLHKEIDELMHHFGRLANNASKFHDQKHEEAMWFNNGVVEGMNKIWKLLFVEDVSVKDIKKY